MNSQEYPAQSEQSQKEEQSTAATEQQLPTAGFPREYVLAAFVNLQDAQQAADALRNSGFGNHEILILEGSDFMEAVAQDQSPFNIITSANHDDYMVEVKRGRSFLAVRPENLAQLEPIRDLLAPHGAYLVKYHDTWSQRELLP